MAKALFDRMLEKFVSRKFLVFATATGLLAYSNLDSETWGLIAITYIGSQGAIDAMKMWRHGA
jgi:hypothetical protein